MKEILLLRHGKSDWDIPGADFDRPLAKRGRRDARRIGQWLRANQLIPDVVLSSPALRALETAVRCVKAAGLSRECIVPEARIYEAAAGTLADVIASRQEQPGRLLLVGHNPGLDDLLAMLVPGALPTRPDGKLMTTAALAILELDGSVMRLRQLVRPADL